LNAFEVSVKVNRSCHDLPTGQVDGERAAAS
jgi:hypothetical protein